MDIFDYIKDNFTENLAEQGFSWTRILDKGVVLPNTDNYFDMPGLTVSVLTIYDSTYDVNAKIYVLGRSAGQSQLNDLYPELTLPFADPVDLEQKMNSVKTTALKMSSFPVGINIDEGGYVVPA